MFGLGHLSKILAFHNSAIKLRTDQEIIRIDNIRDYIKLKLNYLQGWLTRFKERHGISDIKSSHVSLFLSLLIHSGMT